MPSLKASKSPTTPKKASKKTKKLQKFEDILLARKQNLVEILDIKNANIRDLHASNITDDSDLVSAKIQGNLDALIIEKYTIELAEIEFSLQKIQNNCYGICEMCDEPISQERLVIKPHARFCITCREIYEKEIYEKERLQKANNP